METEKMIPEEYEDEEAEETEDRFEVTDDQKALWCVRKIQRAQKDYDALKEHYERELEKAKKRLDSTKDFLSSMLQDYMLSGIPLRETKTMWTYALPGAKLKMTKPTTVLAHDDEKLIPALREARMDEFIKVKESVNWAELKKRILETGEAFDGVWEEERGSEVKVEFEK